MTTKLRLSIETNGNRSDRWTEHSTQKTDQSPDRFFVCSLSSLSAKSDSLAPACRIQDCDLSGGVREFFASRLPTGLVFFRKFRAVLKTFSATRPASRY